ncbi:AraC family transcriptional regulator [Streptomyces sp. NPDC047315]|uniref:AraC family transcriptional regulator n=1 Tax=Streptomyces sp. NPDC047315 TaxID=3155142 RepID=UPI00340C4EB8
MPPHILTPDDNYLTLGDMSLIRGASLQGYSELVRLLGADPQPLLEAAGVPPTAIGEADAFIAYRALIDAVESAARVTGALDFGLRLALRQGIEILGPVGAAALSAPTVADGLRAVGQYLAVYSPAIKGHVSAPPDSRHARFEFRVVGERMPPHRQVTELSLGVSLRVLQLLIGPDFRPVGVHLAHDALSPPKEYERYFDCPARFAEPFSGFRIRRAELRRPLHAHGAVHDVVREYLNSIASTAARGTPAEAATALARRLLPTGGLCLELVAAHLAVHPRTLQRHLAAEGVSFGDLVDTVRKEEADRYLRDTDMPLSQLAGLLGYSEQSVLTRACRRWFGSSPRNRRQELRQR